MSLITALQSIVRRKKGDNRIETRDLAARLDAVVAVSFVYD
jgi:hypothetical protein